MIDTEFANSFGQVSTSGSSGQRQPGPRRRPAQDVVLLPDGRVVVAGTSSDGTTTSIGLVRDLTEKPPTISISDATVTEGDAGTVIADFTVTLSGAYRVPITVNVATTGGSALSGTDFTALPVPTTLTFPAGPNEPHGPGPGERGLPV